MKTLARFCCAVLLMQSAIAQACGVCVEDKVAATYDYAVVQRAAAQGRVVVFCEVVGPVDAARIRQATRNVRGLDASTLRVSETPAAISFVVDTRKQSPQAAAGAIQQGLARGIEVKVLRLADSKGLREPTAQAAVTR
ncbi:MAG TPA: hypothetical protein VNS31_06540 [Ramlibacter sp.]|jgi:hypothetical protein|nr:hypothetical protein [Ramlibacter sp.]